MKLFNLEKHRSIKGKSRHVSTVCYNLPYAICKHKKYIEENNKSIGEYFVIKPN